MNPLILTTISAILLLGCNSIHTAKQMNRLPDELQLGYSILTQDTISVSDFPTITEEQRNTLHLKSGLIVPDSTRAIGMREIEGNRTLEASLLPLSEEPNDFKVYLTTRGSDGYGIHTIDLGRFHSTEHQGPMRFGGNRFYTLDTSISFDGISHFTVHRVMTLTSHFLKDHTLTEMWRVEWDDHYEISSDGTFSFTGQQETYRTDGVDDPMIEEYQSRYHE